MSEINSFKEFKNEGDIDNAVIALSKGVNSVSDE